MADDAPDPTEEGPTLDWLTQVALDSPCTVMREDEDGEMQVFKVTVEEVEGL